MEYTNNSSDSILLYLLYIAVRHHSPSPPPRRRSYSRSPVRSDSPIRDRRPRSPSPVGQRPRSRSLSPRKRSYSPRRPRSPSPLRRRSYSRSPVRSYSSSNRPYSKPLPTGVVYERNTSSQPPRPNDICYGWRDTGTCRWGNSCKFLHDAKYARSGAVPGDVAVRSRHSRSPLPPRRDYGGRDNGDSKQICYDYQRSGTCRFGESCRYVHGAREDRGAAGGSRRDDRSRDSYRDRYDDRDRRTYSPPPRREYSPRR